MTQLEAEPRTCARCGATNRLLYSVRRFVPLIPGRVEIAYEYICGVCCGDSDWPKRDHAA